MDNTRYLETELLAYFSEIANYLAIFTLKYNFKFNIINLNVFSDPFEHLLKPKPAVCRRTETWSLFLDLFKHPMYMDGCLRMVRHIRRMNNDTWQRRKCKTTLRSCRFQPIKRLGILLKGNKTIYSLFDLAIV